MRIIRGTKAGVYNPPETITVPLLWRRTIPRQIERPLLYPLSKGVARERSDLRRVKNSCYKEMESKKTLRSRRLPTQELFMTLFWWCLLSSFSGVCIVSVYNHWRNVSTYNSIRRYLVELNSTRKGYPMNPYTFQPHLQLRLCLLRAPAQCEHRGTLLCECPPSMSPKTPADGYIYIRTCRHIGACRYRDYLKEHLTDEQYGKIKGTM